MKRSLVVLAILGATTRLAHAHSSVTRYGLADMWVGKNSTKTLADAASSHPTTPFK